MLALLSLEGYELNMTSQDIIEMGLRITALSDHHEIVDWINNHISLTK